MHIYSDGSFVTTNASKEYPKRLMSWSIYVVFSLLFFLFGCASIKTPGDLKKNEDLLSLLESYKERNARLAEQRKKYRERGIRALYVSKSKSGNNYQVSVELVHASIPAVVDRLLEETRIPYLFESVELSGYTTTRFDNLPLLDAMGLILESGGYSSTMRNNVLVIKNGTPKPPPESTDPKASFQLEVPLEHIDAAEALSLLNNLYPLNENTGERVVYFGQKPGANSIFLSGPAAEVTKAAQVLRKADRDPEHVLIEALVIEFDVAAFERIGVDFANAAKNEFSNINASFGSLLANSLIFTFTEGASNPGAFTAIIDALIDMNKARIISRPYVATLSGKKAKIDISRNRYVLVDSSQDGATVVSSQAVEAGVMMEITPSILSDGTINMVVDVEDSQFVPTTKNVAVEVDKNSVTTNMQVDSGQTIIIGGLVHNEKASSNSGFPWLRHVPGVNLVFANQEETTDNQEVVIYVTPHIWSPDLKAPMAKPEAFTIKEDEDNLTDFEKLNKK